MSILAAPRPAVQTDAELEAAAHALLARYDAEARAGVARLLPDLDEAALVDDVKGHVAYVLDRAVARARP